MNTTAPAGNDFHQLRESGMRAGSSKSIGTGFVVARNALARGLIRLGVRPNHLSVAGFVANCAAAACLVIGAGCHAPWESGATGVAPSYWPLLAAACLFAAGACDMLDGAVARLGNLSTEFGGVLDSVLDRLSEIVVYLGVAVHFAVSGNVTYVALAIVALGNGLMISYVKARAEDCIADCSVGFWQRGERSAAILLACIFAHVPVLLWQQAVLPFFTFLLRVRYARAAIRAKQVGQRLPASLPGRNLAGLLRPWRHPRGTIPYDLTVGFNIACLLALPWIHPVFYGAADPLGIWLAEALRPA